MFSEISRYNGLEDLIAPDVKGRMLKSRSPRPTPEVTGEMLHGLEDKDRLDHLGYTYYREPGKWWRFCDANTAFLSPCALLGTEPVVTAAFPVTYTGSDKTVAPPWYRLIKALKDMPGVREVLFDMQVDLVTQSITYKERVLEIHTEQVSRFFTVTYNRLSVTPLEIREAIESEGSGFLVGDYRSVGRLGKSILIPPDLVE